MSTVFVAVNGDNVGDSIGSAIAEDNHEELSRLSGSINDSHTQIDEWIKTVGGRVISTSGDEGIYQVSSEVIDQLDSIRADYAAQTGHTLTVGVGESVSQASKALLYGKYNDKDQIVHYEPAIEDYINQDESQDGMQPEGELPPEQDIIDGAEAEAEAAQGIPQHEEGMSEEQNAQHDQQEQAADEMDSDNIEADAEMAMDDSSEEYADDSIGDFEEDNAGLETDSVGEETPEEIVDGVAGQEGVETTEGGDEMDGIDGDIDGQDPMEAGAAEQELQADAADGAEEAEGHEGALTNMIEGHMGEEEEMPQEGMEAGAEEMPMDEEMGQEAPIEEEMAPEMSEEQIAQDMEGGDEMQEMEGEEELLPEGEELEGGGDAELKADIADSLMSFKQHKDLLEELQQTRPELYTGTITMLRAMIEMSKRLGFAPSLGDEEEMIEGDEEQMSEEEIPQEMSEGDMAGGEVEEEIEEEIDPEAEEAEAEANEPEMPDANEEEDDKLGK